MSKPISMRELMFYAVEHRVSLSTAAIKLKASETIKDRASDLRREEEDQDDTIDYWEAVSRVISKLK